MSTYSGRHRPPTRAERRSLERRSSLPKSLTPAYALPTAAAVALALTAAGATAAQSTPFGDLGATAMSGGDAAEGAAALLEDTDVTESARTQVDADSRDTSALTERRPEASATGAGDRDREERADRSESRDERSAGDEDDEDSADGTDSRSDEDSDEDSDSSESSRSWVKPLDDAVFTSPYGHRWGRLHAGQDYAADIGTPLKSMGRGEVIGAGPMSGYGKYIDIRYTDGTVSRYGHIDSFSAGVGTKVSPGDVVAKSGNTGQSTGPHLHLEIRPGGGEPIDPAPWLAERGID